MNSWTLVFGSQKWNVCYIMGSPLLLMNVLNLVQGNLVGMKRIWRHTEANTTLTKIGQENPNANLDIPVQTRYVWGFL